MINYILKFDNEQLILHLHISMDSHFKPNCDEMIDIHHYIRVKAGAKRLEEKKVLLKKKVIYNILRCKKLLSTSCEWNRFLESFFPDLSIAQWMDNMFFRQKCLYITHTLFEEDNNIIAAENPWQLIVGKQLIDCNYTFRNWLW